MIRRQFSLPLNQRLIPTCLPQVLQAVLHPLVLVLLPAVDSLRSYLAKSANQLMYEILHTFRNKMDAELEYIMPVLVKKAGENSFLSNEVRGLISQ